MHVYNTSIQVAIPPYPPHTHTGLLVRKFCRPSPNFKGNWPKSPLYFNPWLCMELLGSTTCIWAECGSLYSVVFNTIQWSSPHGTLDSDPMQIQDPDQMTTLLPHFLNPDPSCVCEIQSSIAMRVVCVPCGAYTQPHWIRIRNSHPVNPVSVPMWRAPMYDRSRPKLVKLGKKGVFLVKFYKYWLEHDGHN